MLKFFKRIKVKEIKYYGVRVTVGEYTISATQIPNIFDTLFIVFLIMGYLVTLWEAIENTIFFSLLSAQISF